MSKFFKLQLSDLSLFFWINSFFCICCTIILSLYFQSNVIGILTAICGILYALFAGEGKMLCFLFGLFYCLGYFHISFETKLYGDMMLALFYMPINLFGIYHWCKHQTPSKTSIQIRKLPPYGFLFWLALSIIASIIYGFWLQSLDSLFAFFNAFSVVAQLFAFYLQTQRYQENYLLVTLANFVSLGIWLTLFWRDQSSFAQLFNHLIFLILGIFYFFRWKRVAQ